jgi:hypothetical protein
VLKFRHMLAAGAVAAASLAATAVPAMAFPIPAVTTHTAFTVIDGNGVLYTSQALTAGQVIHHDGVWYTVRSVRPYGLAGKTWIITITPHAPAGARIQFWT